MSGISRMIAKQLSASLGITDNPKYNPMFKQTEEVLTDVADPSDPTVARFYSPLESAIDEAPIGKEGTRGENIEAFVRKRAPKVTQAEMEYRGLGLEPGELYTAETAKEGLGALEIKAVDLVKIDPKERGAYRFNQRINNIEDYPTDYVELGLTAKGSTEGKLPGLKSMDHYREEDIVPYSDTVLAHTRYSVRVPENNKKYILIEELQSDSVQGIVDDPAKLYQKAKEDYNKLVDSQLDDVENEGFAFDVDMSDYVSTMKNVYRELETIVSTSDNVTDDIIELGKKNGITHPPAFIVRRSPISIVDMIHDKKITEAFDPDLEPELESFVSSVRTLLESNLDKPVLSKKQKITAKQTPVTKTTEYVRMLIQSVIVDAKNKGIDEIVIPPLQAILDQPDRTVANTAPFKATYVDAVNKVLKGLKAELGNQVSIGKKQLPYRTNELENKTYDAKVIDISNLTIDPTNIKLRFNKGGLVERPTK